MTTLPRLSAATLLLALSLPVLAMHDSMAAECPTDIAYLPVAAADTPLAALKDQARHRLAALGVRADWQAPEGQPFSDSPADRAALAELLAVVLPAYERYPRELLQGIRLQSLAFVKNLRVAGQQRRAMPAAERDSVVYASIDEPTTCGVGVEMRAHHELYHFIDARLFGHYYHRDPQWLALNPATVQYGAGGSTAYGARFDNLGHPQPGLVSRYAGYGPEEDKAEVFGWLMTPGYAQRLRGWAEQDPALAAKRDFMVALLQRLGEGRVSPTQLDALATPPDLAALRRLFDANRFVQLRPLMAPLLARPAPDAATRGLIYDWLAAIDDLAGFEARLQAQPRPEAVDLIAAGRLALWRHQLDNAAQRFTEARDLADSAALRERALRGLADVAYERRDYAGSLRQLEAARREAVTPDLLMALNETLIRLGRTNEAIAAAEEALRLNPDHERAHYQLGNGYTRANYTELSRRCAAGFQQAATLTRRASDAFEQQALDLARLSATQALQACAGYGRAHAVLAKVAEAQRLRVDVHRDDAERRFDAMAMPDIPGIDKYVRNWADLTPRHRKRVALSIAPWKAYVPVLVAGGATHFIKPLYMRLSETPGGKALRDARIDYDSRLWDDVRGMGGHLTVTGIEDVERSILGRYNTVLHELSHQVHGVMTAADKREIQDLYRQAKLRDAKDGDAFLSRYAGGSIWEYLAEGAHAQDTPQRDAHDFREITRERLTRKDPALQALVLRLFAQTDVSASLPPALVNDAQQQMTDGQLAPALKQLQRAAQLAPDDEQVLAARLNALGVQGRLAAVEPIARRALARHPDSGALRVAVIDARWHAGRPLPPQLAALTRGRERLAEQDRFDVDMAAGGYALHLGRADDALAAFDRALASQADSPEALWGRAAALALARRWDDAFATYAQALQLRTGLLALRLDFARDLLLAGRTDLARAELAEARTLGPGDPELLALQGWLALLDHDKEQALALARQALATAPWCDSAHVVQAAALGRRGEAGLRALQGRLKPGATPRYVYRADTSSWISVNRAPEAWRRMQRALLDLR